MSADPGARGYEAAKRMSEAAAELAANFNISPGEALALMTTAYNSVTEEDTHEQLSLHTGVAFLLGWTLALFAAAIPGVRPLLALGVTYLTLAVVVGVLYGVRAWRERQLVTEEVVDLPDFLAQHEPPPYPESGLDWEPDDPADPYR